MVQSELGVLPRDSVRNRCKISTPFVLSHFSDRVPVSSDHYPVLVIGHRWSGEVTLVDEPTVCSSGATGPGVAGVGRAPSLGRRDGGHICE